MDVDMEDDKALGFFRFRAASEHGARPWRRVVVTCLAMILVTQYCGTVLAQDEGQSEVPQQVLIEVFIVEIETGKASEIGFNLSYSRDVEHGSAVRTVGLQTFRLASDDEVTFPTAATGPSPPASPIPQRTAALGLNLAGDFVIGDRDAVFARMRAMVGRGDVQIMSRPIVVVKNGTKAEIHAGSEFPYQELKFDKRGTSQLAVAFKKVGVDLVVTPEIMSDMNTVKLTIEKVSIVSVGRVENIRGIDLPFFNERNETTTVRVPDRQLLVIGGLRSKEERESVRRVPVLGRIPVLGALFRSTELSTVESELRIYITPTILRRGQQVPLPPEFTHAEEARRKFEEEL